MDDISSSRDSPLDHCINELTRLRDLTANLEADLQERRANRPSRPNSPKSLKYEGETNENEIPSIDHLAELCARLKLSQAKLISEEQKWHVILEDHAMYSAIVNNEIHFPEKEPLPYSASFMEKMSSKIQYNNNCIYYVWVKFLRGFTYRILGITAAGLSGVVLWSETTMAIPINLSPFALVLKIFDEDGLESGILFKISALIPLLYMSACVYTSLFKVSIFGPNCLSGSKQSTGVALLFNAQYLIRMQFPLGYNYLNL